MRYLYYPGCSLTGTAREYDLSVRAVMAKLDVELAEISDWTCCGASAAASSSELLSLVLPARNLALAEQMPGSDGILVPCSACYLNLKKAEKTIVERPEQRQRINAVLAVESLAASGGIRVRHLLDVLSRDIGPEAVGRRVVRDLHGLTVAPYYGCQCLRPYPVFDDPEAPRSMEMLILATGAAVFPWKAGGNCCGAAHMQTKPDVGIQLVAGILNAARDADLVVTVCPMCQMNLEAYQNRIRLDRARSGFPAILYLPQLLGAAMGLSEQALGLHYNLSRDWRKLEVLAG